MQFSYSRVSSFEQCPYKWRLHYIDGLETLPDDDPKNALIIGTALHRGIETDADTAIREYYAAYPIITDRHVEEAEKLRWWIPRVKALLPPGENEVKVETPSFVGYLDYVAQNDDGSVDIYDFKYSNAVDRYMASAQLHVYKWYYERTTGQEVRGLHFVFVPKVSIRLKKTEQLYEFRRRLHGELEGKQVTVADVEYQPVKVAEWAQGVSDIVLATDYPKHETRLCDWCDYEKYCKEGIDWMILPKNERRHIEGATRRKVWIYGQAFAGKTTLANAFPSPLMLNTDGNVKFVDAPYIAIKDDITVEGRITKKTLAWQVFKDAIAELEKGQNDFKTIVVDLVEDTYEYCRLYLYDKKGWEHESDDSFRAWDMVRTEFLGTMKRLMNLDYDNIILISHEDSSKDVTKRSGSKITAIKPNIGDKVANKLAGMVDIVGRAVVVDGKHVLTFRTDEVQFGGGRLDLGVAEIPLDYDELVKVYKLGTAKAGKAARTKAPEKGEAADGKRDEAKQEPEEGEGAVGAPAEAQVEAGDGEDIPGVAEAGQPRRRSRLSRGIEQAVKNAEPVEEPEAAPEPEQPVRRVRKRRTPAAEEAPAADAQDAGKETAEQPARRARTRREKPAEEAYDEDIPF